MSLASEAHLPIDRRPMVLVRYFPSRMRRSWRSWALFVGFLVLNETRGTYMAARFLAEFLKAYHHV